MKIAVIGHFGEGHNLVNGQTIKAKNTVAALSAVDGAEISTVDTYGWKKHPFRLLFALRRAVKENDAVIMLPAHNGVQVFSRVLSFFNRRRSTKLYYSVIGAWLPSLLSDKPALKKVLMRFDGLWVETNTMKNALAAMGFDNLALVPNFKNISPICEEEISDASEGPLRLVIFSRISEAKGVTDAVNAVKSVNEKGCSAVLDVYGPVEDAYREKFGALLNENPHIVRYLGVIDSEASVSVLKDYHALLFPTKSYTEGVPGTIIDAYCAALPVISSMWESYADICHEGITSLGYEFDSVEALEQAISRASENRVMLAEMKLAALREGEKYTSRSVSGLLRELIGA